MSSADLSTKSNLLEVRLINSPLPLRNYPGSLSSAGIVDGSVWGSLKSATCCYILSLPGSLISRYKYPLG
jgi:hypothetical protein